MLFKKSKWVLVLVLSSAPFVSHPLFAVESSTPWYLQGAFPGPLDLEACRNYAAHFSSEFNLDKSCFFVLYPNVHQSLKAENRKKGFFAMALDGSVYINQKISSVGPGFQVERRIIAGNNTSLKQIRAVDLSSDGKWVGALDFEGLKIFPSSRHGNTSPSRVIKHQVLDNSTNFRFDEQADQILAFSHNHEKVSILPLSFDSRNPLQGEEVKVLNEIEWSKGKGLGVKDVGVCRTRREVVVLARGSSNLLVFDLSKKKGDGPKKSIPIPSSMNRPMRLELSEDCSELVLLGEDTSQVKVKLDY